MGRPPLASSKSAEIIVLEISEGKCTLGVKGLSPLIYNRVSEKAKRELLMPRGPMNSAEKQTNLKHDPVAEYIASVYRNSGVQSETLLCFPSPGFKKAMMTAALDLPGNSKAQIGRLVWVEGEHVDVYGVPKLKMDIVRNANGVPDIRTRAIVGEWVCKVTVRFVQPNLTARAIYHLMGAAGILAGIGDWRQEKGSGNYGQFHVCEPTDAEYKRIVKDGGRARQEAALEHYECYDAQSAELLDWYLGEVNRRGRNKDAKSIKLQEKSIEEQLEEIVPLDVMAKKDAAKGASRGRNGR